MSDLDPSIHQPVRLQVMAALTALPDDAQMEFVALRKMLELTDGNLSVHLRKLEQEGYVRVEKVFVGRKPRTFIAATPEGRKAFDDHVQALKRIIGE
ncbi:MAG TPA: transcriptional regulator [Anaerolineae bacterium]|nr:transcriptional regulator [Anaerolineae bacterium]